MYGVIEMKKKDIEKKLRETIEQMKKNGAKDAQINDVWISICIDRTGLYHEG